MPRSGAQKRRRPKVNLLLWARPLIGQPMRLSNLCPLFHCSTCRLITEKEPRRPHEATVERPRGDGSECPCCVCFIGRCLRDAKHYLDEERSSPPVPLAEATPMSRAAQMITLFLTKGLALSVYPLRLSLSRLGVNN